MARLHHATSPVRITTAGTSRADDIAGRQRRYLFSMAVRVVCFVGAVLADGWLRWALVAGAVLLPYVAVVFANTEEQRQDGFELRGAPSGRELQAGEGPDDRT